MSVGGQRAWDHSNVNMYARSVYATTSTSVAFAHLVPPVPVRTTGIGGSSTGTLLKFRLQCSLLSTASQLDIVVVPHDGGEATFRSPNTPEDGGSGELAILRHERKAARRTRSFRRRQAPITRGQRRQMRELWPNHGLPMDYRQRWEFDDIFAAASQQEGVGAVVFDIGFGSGDSLLGMAAARPKDGFLGIEVHKPGVAAALTRLEAEALPNVKIAQGDAITALCDNVADRSLDECCVFFPDPFPQSRDAERRLVRPLLLSLLSSKLKPGGLFNVATDVEEYAEHVLVVMEKLKRPQQRRRNHRSQAEIEKLNRFGITRMEEACAWWEGGEAAERPVWRPVTKYEEKAREAGRRVRDFTYRLELAE